MVPSSRFAASWKPSVAYLVLNFCPLWKKQTTLSSFAYAGIPYQVFGESAGALAVMIAWRRLAIARSGSGISAIFARTAFSSFAPRAAAFRSWTVSFIAARSPAVSPVDALRAVLLTDFFVLFNAGFLAATVHLRRRWSFESIALGLPLCRTGARWLSSKLSSARDRRPTVARGKC